MQRVYISHHKLTITKLQSGSVKTKPATSWSRWV